MPSETMDLPGLSSSSSYFSDDTRFPNEVLNWRFAFMFQFCLSFSAVIVIPFNVV